jgi:hypothetical protein
VGGLVVAAVHAISAAFASSRTETGRPAARRSAPRS